MVKIEGMKELKKAFRDLAMKMDKQRDIALSLVGNAYANDVKAIAPRKTTTYIRSIHVEPKAGAESHQGKKAVFVGTDVIYAKQLEFGGVIKAKNAPYLVFQTEDGVWHSVKQVIQNPKPHFRPPLDNNFKKYQDIYLAAMGECIA